MSEGAAAAVAAAVAAAAEGLILCGDMEGVAQYSQSHISKLNSRWTALGRVLWVRCGLVANWIPVGQLALSLTSESGCIMVVAQMRLGFAYQGLSAPTDHI